MPLLKTVEEFKQYVAIDASQLPPSFELELTEVEGTLILPLLGPALAQWLQAAYDAAGFDPLADVPAAGLLRAVQAPLARLAAATGITVHQASLDATGVHIVSTDVVKTAFQWQSRELQALHQRRGLAGLDALVQWLEDHREDSPELKAWASSPAGQRHRQELFTSTADFQEYENISASRLVFQALRPVRRRLEACELYTVLGGPFLEELHEQVRTRSLSSENENLLRSRIYPALACLSIAHAVPALSLVLNGDGIDLAVARRDDANSKEADAGLDALLQAKGFEALQLGQRYLRQLGDFLDGAASASRFTTYFNSAAYTSPTSPAAVLNAPDTRLYKFA
ncbi:MAG: DUF6712 family protein [Janthinobacterium lividum]